MSDVDDASWADGEVAGHSTHSLTADLVDFGIARGKVVDLIANDEGDHALELLGQLARWPDSTRHLEDNVWLYELSGRLQQQAGDSESALESYARGFALEPRHRTLVEAYADLLFEMNRFEEGLRVVQQLLLHHKRDLPPVELAGIYRRLGASYEALRHFPKARTAYEKALEQDQADQLALTGLLRVVSEVAEPTEVIRVRQKLVRSLREPAQRSIALLALGDDWRNEFNDSGRALDVYEQALQEDPQNRAALQRIARVGTEVGDWRRVSRAYFTLAELSEDMSEKADWIVRASVVARDELWEADKALNGFRAALKLDPSRLDAFKAVTSLLVDGQKWEDLEQAYLQVITDNVQRGATNDRVLSVLWQKLGDLYRLHLDREKDAVFAYSQAADRLPDNMGLHAAVVNLAEVNVDHLDKAVHHLREMMRLSDDDGPLLERLGKVYMRQKAFDRALCVYRALAYVGMPLDEKAKGFVDRFDTAMFRPIETKLTPSVLKQFIYHEEMDNDLSMLFGALKAGLDEWTGEDKAKYGLKRKDRVKVDEPLAFNNIYRSIGQSLGWETLPELWHKPDQSGLINGALVPEGLIAGQELLGSGREEFMAFIIAKQLFLFLPPFYLASIRPPTDLKIFLQLAAIHVRPDIQPGNLDKGSESALKAIKKRVRGKDFEQMKKAIDHLSSRQPDIERWVDVVEDCANRVGLLFADDLKVCKEYLDAEAQTLGSRTADQRMASILSYAVSDKFMDLRERLGLAVAS